MKNPGASIQKQQAAAALYLLQPPEVRSGDPEAEPNVNRAAYGFTAPKTRGFMIPLSTLAEFDPEHVKSEVQPAQSAPTPPPVDEENSVDWNF